MVTTEMNRLSYEEPVATNLTMDIVFDDDNARVLRSVHDELVSAMEDDVVAVARIECHQRVDHEVSGAIRGNDIEIQTPHRRRWCRNSGLHRPGRPTPAGRCRRTGRAP